MLKIDKNAKFASIKDLFINRYETVKEETIAYYKCLGSDEWLKYKILVFDTLVEYPSLISKKISEITFPKTINYGILFCFLNYLKRLNVDEYNGFIHCDNLQINGNSKKMEFKFLC